MRTAQHEADATIAARGARTAQEPVDRDVEGIGQGDQVLSRRQHVALFKSANRAFAEADLRRQSPLSESLMLACDRQAGSKNFFQCHGAPT